MIYLYVTTIQLKITGKVQGVFYRQSAKRYAEKLDLKGWIKNMDDGSVLSIIQGVDNNVEQFISWCKVGPEDAFVENVIIENIDHENFDKFQIVR